VVDWERWGREGRGHGGVSACNCPRDVKMAVKKRCAEAKKKIRDRAEEGSGHHDQGGGEEGKEGGKGERK